MSFKRGRYRATTPVQDSVLKLPTLRQRVVTRRILYIIYIL